MYIFSMDNPFFQFIGKLVDLVWLNILTLVCCLPVFTAGAALSAMYSVLIKMALKEEGVITKPFFRAFKENLKKMGITNYRVDLLDENKYEVIELISSCFSTSV